MAEVDTPTKRQTAWHVTIHLSSGVLPNETLLKTSCIEVRPVEVCPNVMGESRFLFSENPSICKHVLLYPHKTRFYLSKSCLFMQMNISLWFTLTKSPTGPNMQLSTVLIWLKWAEDKDLRKRLCLYEGQFFNKHLCERLHVITQIP